MFGATIFGSAFVICGTIYLVAGMIEACKIVKERWS